MGTPVKCGGKRQDQFYRASEVSHYERSLDDSSSIKAVSHCYLFAFRGLFNFAICLLLFAKHSSSLILASSPTNTHSWAARGLVGPGKGIGPISRPMQYMKIYRDIGFYFRVQAARPEQGRCHGRSRRGWSTPSSITRASLLPG